MRIVRRSGPAGVYEVVTRDRNLLGLFAYFMSAHELDVRNLIVITGDPPKMGDFPDATAVCDLVLVGLLPLASHRNAESLHNEVPGMQIPEAIRERMRKAGSGDAARREGVAISRDRLASVRNRVAGAYIMPPFGRYELALDAPA